MGPNCILCIGEPLFKTTCNILERPRFYGPVGNINIAVALHTDQKPYPYKMFYDTFVGLDDSFLEILYMRISYLLCR